MAPIHRRSREVREPKLWLFSFAFNAWLACIAAGLLLIAFRQNFFPPSNDPATTQLLDALTLASAAMTTAMLFRRGRPESVSHWEAVAVGLFWVAMSLISEQVYRLYINERHALQFLLAALMGDSHPGEGWVWNVFLIVQLSALSVVKFLREGVSKFRTTRIAREY